MQSHCDERAITCLTPVAESGVSDTKKKHKQINIQLDPMFSRNKITRCIDRWQEVSFLLRRRIDKSIAHRCPGVARTAAPFRHARYPYNAARMDIAEPVCMYQPASHPGTHGCFHKPYDSLCRLSSREFKVIRRNIIGVRFVTVFVIA